MITIPIQPDSDVELIQDTFLNDPDYPLWEAKAKAVYDKLPAYYKDKRPYQWEWPAMYCIRNSNLFAGSMGIGKTLITLILIQTLYQLDRPGQVHIAVPTMTLFGEWKAELDRVIPGSYVVIRNQNQLKKATAPIFLYTMDLPKCNYKVAEDSPYEEEYAMVSLADWITQYRAPDLFVLDELDEVRKPNSQRYQHLLQVRQSSNRVLGLTGTPAESPEDIHNLCQFIYQDEWPFETLKEFEYVFVDKKELKTHYVKGSKETEASKRWLSHIKFHKISQYAELLQTYIHRATLDDPDVTPFITVPEQIENHQSIAALPATTNLYEQAVADNASMINLLAKSDRSAEALNLCNTLIKTVNHPKHKTAKVQALEEILARHKKVLIFTDRIESALYLHENHHIGTWNLTSDMSSLQREKLLEEAKTEPGDLILPLRIGSKGLNLPQFDAVVVYCMGWSGTRVAQAILRAARPGSQYANVSVYFLFHKHMVDEHQHSVITEKMQNLKKLLDLEGYGDLIENVGQSVLSLINA
jgi:superfamily II DNA or RNA helicase